MDGHVILSMVGDSDDNSITFSCIHRWPRIHPVHRHNWFGMAQPANILHHHLIRLTTN